MLDREQKATMNSLSQEYEKLKADGWHKSNQPFWLEEPCFYDLSLTKTVLLFPGAEENPEQTLFFWKYDWHEMPDYLNADRVEIRRYKLHHSMNALLWYDYGDRRIVH